MTSNGLVAVILRYFTVASGNGKNCVKVVEVRPNCDKNVAQRISAATHDLIAVIFSEITEKQCVKERYRHSKAKIRLVQHGAAILATAKFLLLFAHYCSTVQQKLLTSYRSRRSDRRLRQSTLLTLQQSEISIN